MYACLYVRLWTITCLNTYQVSAYWQQWLEFWEKPPCHQTLTRSGGGWTGEKLLKPVPLSLLLSLYFPPSSCLLWLAVHFSRVVVIASSPKAKTETYTGFSVCARVCACIVDGVCIYEWGLEGAKSSKWCHQANWGLIKACWSGPINLSITFLFQTLSALIHTYMYACDTLHRSLSLDCRICHTILRSVT